jgi:HEAT repeat protein
MAVLCTAAPDGRPVYAAGQVLSTIGRPGIAALATAIGDPDSTVSQNAAAALGFLDFEQRHDPTSELLPLVSDPRSRVRSVAVSLIRLDGAQHQEALTAMARALSDENAEVRGAAAGRLSYLQGDSHPLIGALIRALRDSASSVRVRAARALGNTKAWDSLAVAALSATMLRDPDPDVPPAAAAALGDLGAAAYNGIPALITALGHPEAGLHATVIMALGHIGADSIPDRRALLAALSRTIRDDDSTSRELAVRSLREIGVPAGAELIEALGARDPNVRAIASQALGEQSPTPQAINALVARLGDTDAQARTQAVNALGGFGPDIAPRMRTLAADSSQRLRRSAAKVLDYLKQVDRLPIVDRCYELSLAPWTPRLDIGVDTIYSTPPMIVRFTRVYNDWFAEEGKLSFRVLPANRADMSVHGPGFWTPVTKKDSVSIVWSTGFSGLTMKLAVAADSLRGQAETFWDFPRPQQTAQVMGRGIPCK